MLLVTSAETYDRACHVSSEGLVTARTVAPKWSYESGAGKRETQKCDEDKRSQDEGKAFVGDVEQ